MPLGVASARLVVLGPDNVEPNTIAITKRLLSGEVFQSARYLYRYPGEPES